MKIAFGKSWKDIFVVIEISVIECQQRGPGRKLAAILDRVDQVFHRNQRIMLREITELLFEQRQIQPLDFRKPGKGERTHIVVHHDRQLRRGGAHGLPGRVDCTARMIGSIVASGVLDFTLRNVSVCRVATLGSLVTTIFNPPILLCN